MAVTDYKYAGTAANVDNFGNEWANPNYAKADDVNYTDVTLDAKTGSDWLTLTNYGFTSSDIPDGSTIDGIEFVIGRAASANNVVSEVIVRLKNVTTPTNMASATKWPMNTITAATYGGATSKCCSAVTQANIVSSDFGIELYVNSVDTTRSCWIDYIKIRVYYTKGGASVKPYYYYLNQ